jgi:hypothetical protein
MGGELLGWKMATGAEGFATFMTCQLIPMPKLASDRHICTYSIAASFYQVNDIEP